MPSKKDVVVVGGGGAGAAVARGLSQKLDPQTTSLTLVTARPFYTWLPAAIRMTTTSEGKLEDSALVKYDKLFVKGNGTLKIGRVTAVEAKEKGGELVLENGERIHYDILVLAPGSHWQGHISLPDGREAATSHISDWRSKFEKASSIVFVGGGAVGIESAGEVKDFLPKKKVTIVHAGSQLLNDTYPAKYRKRVESDIRSRGVDIVFNDYVDNLDTLPVVTRSGKTIEADLVVPTVGGRPATEFVASIASGVLNAKGQIKVNPTLEVAGHPGIFALGDAIEWDEVKQVAKYAKHSEVVVANVLASLKGATPSKKCTGNPEMILVTNGRTKGVGYVGMMGGIVMGNWFASMAKGKTLMVPMAQKAVGY